MKPALVVPLDLAGEFVVDLPAIEPQDFLARPGNAVDDVVAIDDVEHVLDGRNCLAVFEWRSIEEAQQHLRLGSELKAGGYHRAVERAKTEELPRHHTTKAPAMPDMSSSDRAAIATSTGFYISPTGEVTPDGMPPWSFIMATIEKRHAGGSTETAAPQEADSAPATTTSGEGVDVLA